MAANRKRRHIGIKTLAFLASAQASVSVLHTPGLLCLVTGDYQVIDTARYQATTGSNGYQSDIEIFSITL